MNRIYAYQTRNKHQRTWLRWKSVKGHIAIHPEGGLFVRRMGVPTMMNTQGWTLEDALIWLAR